MTDGHGCTYVRRPRVNLFYRYDHPPARNPYVELPFAVAILADLSGVADRAPLAERKLLDVDIDNVDDHFKKIRPRLSFTVPDPVRGGDDLPVELELTWRSCLRPGLVLKVVPDGTRLWLEREAPDTGADRKEEIDRELSAWTDAILHHPDCQRLEGTWSALGRLVETSETDEMLKLEVLDVTKQEIADDLAGGWERSNLYRILYRERLCSFEGDALSCVIGDFGFDHSDEDLAILRGLGRIARESVAPFIAGAVPSLLGRSSWSELAGVEDVAALFDGPEYAAWRALRASPDARYLALTLPRYLARQPWVPGMETEAQFEYREDISDETCFTWANAAWLVAGKLAFLYKRYWWTAQFRGPQHGGVVSSLPCVARPDDAGGVREDCRAEVAVTDRTRPGLEAAGLFPLCHPSPGALPWFAAGETLHAPSISDDFEETANAILAARLPYVFGASRIALYVRQMIRDRDLWIGDSATKQDVEERLNAWLGQYVNPLAETELDLLKAPLAAATVEIGEGPGPDGEWVATLDVQPQLHLEGLTRPIRLKLRVPTRDPST